MLIVNQSKGFWTPRYRIQGVRGSRVQGKAPSSELRTPNLKGFTIIEVILVMMIIAILAAVAIPRFDFATSSRASVDGGAYMIASDIRYAQEFAMANRVSKQVIFTINSPTYSFSPTSNLDPSGRLPSGVTISNNFTITFNSLGEPTTGGGGSVSVSGGGQTRTITVVNYTGKVNIN
jgi:prepilin-type N-terminal cleavage/methylation domain-containing protein